MKRGEKKGAKREQIEQRVMELVKSQGLNVAGNSVGRDRMWQNLRVRIGVVKGGGEGQVARKKKNRPGEKKEKKRSKINRTQ